MKFWVMKHFKPTQWRSSYHDPTSWMTKNLHCQRQQHLQYKPTSTTQLTNISMVWTLTALFIRQLQRWPREMWTLHNTPLCSAGSAATSTCASVPLSPTRDPSVHKGTSVASSPGHESPTFLQEKTHLGHLVHINNVLCTAALGNYIIMRSSQCFRGFLSVLLTFRLFLGLNLL